MMKAILLLGLVGWTVAILGSVDDVAIDSDIIDIAMKGVVKLNAERDTTFASKLVRVNTAQKQIINGWLLFLDVEIATTNCRNDNNIADYTMCMIIIDGKHEKCLFKIMTLEGALQLQQQECAQINPPTHFLPDVRSKGQWSLRSFLDRFKVHHNADVDAKILKDEFFEFTRKYNKDYDSEEEFNNRFDIYKKNKIEAKRIQKLESGTAKYGVTKFMDMNKEEFESTHHGFYGNSEPHDIYETPDVAFPSSMDWRTKHAVTNVKNQGSCGSCWAFSTVGNIEGQWAINHGQLESLSVQELVDCDKVDQGCGGGLPSNAYKEIIRIGGLETEKDYPYTGAGNTCQFEASKVFAKINGSVTLSQNETRLAQWLAQNGPISIGINAMMMQFYIGGISHPYKFLCNPANLDHGVLIVGYGVEENTPYWIIKNSWGLNWGEAGYYRVYRGDGTCGLNKMATSATTP